MKTIIFEIPLFFGPPCRIEFSAMPGVGTQGHSLIVFLFVNPRIEKYFYVEKFVGIHPSNLFND